ncbi:hypothetical protein R5R35_008615 [Gryllus longicercus]|uniref:Uncharacterized protein n=1 Tax=Gryllus longicercus TaxID=2509291 RepID=A0AAN9VMR1_9ORTH
MHLQNKRALELLELETANLLRKPSVDPKEKLAQKRVKAPSAPHIFITVADGTIQQIELNNHFITYPNIL